jgi:hypothetical protein
MKFAKRTQAVLFAAALLALRCGGPAKLSSAPEGITVFEDRNYGGRSLTLDQDQRDLNDIAGPCVKSDQTGASTTYRDTWDDCISSVRVSAAWTGTAYGDEEYKGSSLPLTEDIPDLKKAPGKCGDGMDDCISSIRVSRR